MDITILKLLSYNLCENSFIELSIEGNFIYLIEQLRFIPMKWARVLVVQTIRVQRISKKITMHASKNLKTNARSTKNKNLGSYCISGLRPR